MITQHHKKTPVVYIIGAVVFVAAALLFTTGTISADDSKEVVNTKEILFTTPVVQPHISLEYGWTINPFTQKQMFHNGMDMKLPVGTPITAVSDGKIGKINRDIKDDYGIL